MNNEYIHFLSEQHAAIVGKTGSGKSYTAKGVVESLLDKGRRVCIIDPTAIWWGLRSSADGKRPGYAVAIFGGDHGDVPISATSGGAVARIIAENNLPSIVDVSQMLIGERHRWAEDFFAELYRLNNKPLHLIIDEADEFAPQNPLPETKRMLHQVDRIVRRGRSKGFRVMLITQRPAVLHKNVLTQANSLVAMRLTAPQDRKAIEEWIKGQADLQQGKDVLATLPRLGRGDGWVWCPEYDVLERRQFPQITTFDSGRTPGDDEEVIAPTQISAVDLTEIRAAFAEAEAEAAANDPKALKDRIKQLEKQLAAKPQTAPNATTTNVTVQLDDDQIRRLQHALVKALRPALSPQAPAPQRQLPQQPIATAPRAPAAALATTGVKLPVGERAVLIAVAQHGSCSREQLTILTAYKRSSRDAYIQRLKEKGYLAQDGDRVKGTHDGIAALGSDYQPLPEGEDLRQYWFQRLPEGERKIFDVVTDYYPDPVTREQIDAHTSYKRSSRDAYIQRLKARELIKIIGRGEVIASAHLFSADE